MHGSPQAHKPLFHFRVFTGGQQHHESDALDFDDLEAAWREGEMSACEIISDMRGRIESDLDWRLEVADETGRTIYRFSFKAERLKGR